jgi:beta-lactamase superfamily II metal-dependent hydrolase
VRRSLPLALTVLLLVLFGLLLQRALSPAPGPVPSGPPPEMPLQIVFLDVGQGDAALIRSPEGGLVLIDGGRSGSLVSDYLQELGVTRLDLVIASHADLDHIGGLAEAVRAFAPRYYLDNGVPHSTQAYARLLEAVEEADATYLEAERRTITLGSVALHILPPPRENQDQNDNSVGAVLAYGDFRAVFSGDATTRTQAWWLGRFGEALAGVQLYKAAHHGSSTGDGPGFMRALSPELVVISVGESNSYGHPSPEALASYEAAGARVYRTDRQGHVTLTVTPGGDWEVATGALPSWSALAPDPEGPAVGSPGVGSPGVGSPGVGSEAGVP